MSLDVVEDVFGCSGGCLWMSWGMSLDVVGDVFGCTVRWKRNQDLKRNHHLRFLLFHSPQGMNFQFSLK